MFLSSGKNTLIRSN